MILRVGDVIRLGGSEYIVDLVNDCRARCQPIGKVLREINGNEFLVSATRNVSISANSGVDLMRRCTPTEFAKYCRPKLNALRKAIRADERGFRPIPPNKFTKPQTPPASSPTTEAQKQAVKQEVKQMSKTETKAAVKPAVKAERVSYVGRNAWIHKSLDAGMSVEECHQKSDKKWHPTSLKTITDIVEARERRAKEEKKAAAKPAKAPKAAVKAPVAAPAPKAEAKPAPKAKRASKPMPPVPAAAAKPVPPLPPVPAAVAA